MGEGGLVHRKPVPGKNRATPVHSCLGLQAFLVPRAYIAIILYHYNMSPALQCAQLNASSQTSDPLAGCKVFVDNINCAGCYALLTYQVCKQLSSISSCHLGTTSLSAGDKRELYTWIWLSPPLVPPCHITPWWTEAPSAPEDLRILKKDDETGIECE